MKKVISIFLTFLLSLSLTACGNNISDKSDTPIKSVQSNVPGSSDEKNNAKQSTSGKNKILIAYFSRVGNTDFDKNVDVTAAASLNLKDGKIVGNTEVIADMIHEAVGGDLFLIQTEKKYPSDYDAVVDYAKQEQNEKARPKLGAHVEKMEDYDIVFIGFSNWWYDMPMAVYNFLGEYDFSGKIIIPFCTHGGSRFSNSEQTLKSMLTGATVMDGLAISGNDASSAQSDVDEWLHSLEY